jgi:transposase
MQTLIERGCGLDVHQATVVACLLMVRRDGKVQKQMRTFGTTTRELGPRSILHPSHRSYALEPS